MNKQLFLCFLLVLPVTDVTAQYTTFVKAIKKELDTVCLVAKGFDSNEASAFVGKCVYEGLVNLPSVGTQVHRLCTNDIVRECIEKFEDIVLSCLPINALKTVSRMIFMDYHAASTLCANEAINFRIIVESPCYLHTQMINEMSKCADQLEKEMESVKLRNYFAKQHCPKFEEYYKCSKEAALICPYYTNTYIDLNNGYAEVSPCNMKNETSFSVK